MGGAEDSDLERLRFWIGCCPCCRVPCDSCLIGNQLRIVLAVNAAERRLMLRGGLGGTAGWVGEAVRWCR